MNRPHQHRLRVAEVIVETAEARSFVLAVPDDLAGTFAYRAGQFLTVRVPGPDGTFVARCYSLSSSPTATGPDARQLTFTVKRMPSGSGSNWLCDHVTPGTELQVLPPAGMFTPKAWDADLLLFAAGSGITPVMSILRTALAVGTGHLVLVYANRDEDSVIFAAALARLVAAHPDRLTVRHWLETDRGRPDASALQTLAGPYAEREVYVCGPEPFMVAAVEAMRALGVPHGRVHVERFVSLPDDPFAVPDETTDAAALLASGPGTRTPDGVLEVELDGERRRLPWPRPARMLDVLLEHGLPAPSSCRQGRCGACTCRLEKGEVSMVENNVLDEEDLAEGYVLACQALPVTDTVRISYD